MTKQHGGGLVDIGNVIIAYRLSGINRGNYLTYDFESIPPEPGCFEALERLNRRFGGNITVVWKGTDDADGRNMRWLVSHRFCERTRIPIDRIHRIGRDRREKASYLAQSSATHEGVTFVVDDRLEVLSHFVGRVPNLFLFQPQEDEVFKYQHTGALARVHVVETWDDVEAILNIK